MTSKNMEDNLKKNGRRAQKKNEDNLKTTRAETAVKSSKRMLQDCASRAGSCPTRTLIGAPRRN
jgi:hypothetical protein